jgi:hypothetical protein
MAFQLTFAVNGGRDGKQLGYVSCVVSSEM